MISKRYKNLETEIINNKIICPSCKEKLQVLQVNNLSQAKCYKCIITYNINNNKDWINIEKEGFQNFKVYNTCFKKQKL